jgi:hypothetical protein
LNAFHCGGLLNCYGILTVVITRIPVPDVDFHVSDLIVLLADRVQRCLLVFAVALHVSCFCYC